MFTREHFEKVASVLSAARASHCVSGSEHNVIDALAHEFANIFAESNERFSRKAFIGACNAASRSEIRRLVNQANVKTIARNRAREAIKRGPNTAHHGKPARFC